MKRDQERVTDSRLQYGYGVAWIFAHIPTPQLHNLKNNNAAGHMSTICVRIFCLTHLDVVHGQLTSL